VPHALMMYGVLHKICIVTQIVKIFLFLLKQKVYHCVHKSWLLVPVEVVESSKCTAFLISFLILSSHLCSWLAHGSLRCSRPKCVHFIYLCSVCSCILPAQCYQPYDIV